VSSGFYGWNILGLEGIEFSFKMVDENLMIVGIFVLEVG